LTLYQDFHAQAYPKKGICLLEKKFFIVQYTPKLIHAIDGLNHGLILVPVAGNFMLKVYDKSAGESFGECVLPILEL